MTTSKANGSLLSLITTATEEDFRLVESEIAEKEQEVGRLKSDIDALKALRIVLRKKLSPAVAAAPKTTSIRQKPGLMSLASEVIALLEETGPLPIADVAERLHRTEQGVKLAVTKTNYALAIDRESVVSLANREQSPDSELASK